MFVKTPAISVCKLSSMNPSNTQLAAEITHNVIIFRKKGSLFGVLFANVSLMNATEDNIHH